MDRTASAGVIDTEEQLVAFDVAGEIYGIDIANVQEIIRLPTITTIPRAPSFVEGVINLRGHIIPVIDLRKRFGIPEAEPTKESRIVVVQVGDSTIGMRVDAVTEVLRIRSDAIEPPASIVTGTDSAFLRGVGRLGGDGEEEALIILLDTEAIISRQDAADLAQVTGQLEATAQKPEEGENTAVWQAQQEAETVATA